MQRQLIFHGLILMLLSLASALFIPLLSIPRLGLSAHLAGVSGSLLLLAMAAIWHYFRLTERQQALCAASLALSGYCNWLGCLLAGLFGAGKTTPIAAAGIEGSAAAEMLVLSLLSAVAITSFIAIGLCLFGLRNSATGAVD